MKVPEWFNSEKIPGFELVGVKFIPFKKPGSDQESCLTHVGIKIKGLEFVGLAEYCEDQSIMANTQLAIEAALKIAYYSDLKAYSPEPTYKRSGGSSYSGNKKDPDATAKRGFVGHAFVEAKKKGWKRQDTRNTIMHILNKFAWEEDVEYTMTNAQVTDLLGFIAENKKMLPAPAPRTTHQEEQVQKEIERAKPSKELQTKIFAEIGCTWKTAGYQDTQKFLKKLRALPNA